MLSNAQLIVFIVMDNDKKTKIINKITFFVTTDYVEASWFFLQPIAIAMINPGQHN